ncbi:hypothetical protein QYM36_016690 [Artemia franciscana]|uniref:Caspase family p20 domain-containing protein n=1 Tax=Artemia franciscana TaxID=6661 RepID=A0AA88HFK0_ARTSF|nr:hypothetical protein QYM36_016690 [Artemia franciscana]
MAVQVNNDMQQSRLDLLQSSPFRIEDVLSLSVAKDFVGHPFKPLRSSKYIRLSDIEMPGQSESLTVAQWNCHLNSNHHEVARLLDLYKNKSAIPERDFRLGAADGHASDLLDVLAKRLKTCDEEFALVFEQVKELSDKIHLAFESQFSRDTLNSFRLYVLLPSNIVNCTDDFLQSSVKEISSMYVQLLGLTVPSTWTKLILAEVHVWSSRWLRVKREGGIFPSSVEETAKELSVASAERSFSTLHKLKTWLRAQIGQTRLSGLALLNVHHDIDINIDRVIERVNIKVFTNSDVPTREGSEIDVLHLRNLFEELKFIVVVKNDVNADKEVCTVSSHAMEEVEDALEVHEKEFSQVKLETCFSDRTENFHLMQPLVLDEIDVETFNKINVAMVITNHDTKPADSPTALPEMPVTEAIEHDRLGSLPYVSDNSEEAAVTPTVPSLASRPGQKRAKNREEKVMQDKRKHPFIDSTPCEQFCRKHCKELTRENHFTIWNSFWEEQYASRLKWHASCACLTPRQPPN